MWFTHNFKGRSKTKIMAKDICRGIVDIECERDWPVDLGATLGGGQEIKENIILVTRIFPGKAERAILLSFECAINPQNLMKIVGAIFDKMKI